MTGTATSATSFATSSTQLELPPMSGEENGKYPSGCDITITETLKVDKVYSTRERYTILSIVALSGMMSPINTTIMYPALPSMARDFHTSTNTINLTIAVFMFCIALFPLGWGTVSDLLGRRYVYLSSLTLYTIASLCLGFARDIPTLLLLRVLQAAGSSSVLSVGAGTIADVFKGPERGRAMGLFYLGPLLGPVLGPVLGGVIHDYVGGWPSIFWFLSILGGIIVIAVWFWLPETMPRRLAHGDGSAEKKGALYMLSKCNPLQPISYFKFTVTIVTTLYTTVVFATIYFINLSLEVAFEEKYHLSPFTIGLTYLGFGVGSIIGSTTGGRLADIFTARSPGRPQLRLKSSLIGAAVYPIGVFGYGISVYYKTNLAIPILSHVLVGFGMTFSYTGIATYLVDIFPGHSARVIAAQNLIRYGAGGIASIIVLPILDHTTYLVMFTILAAINLLAASCIVWTFIRAPGWQEDVKQRLSDVN
ncbi:hypothetical protein SpCBS45565_g00987 [Spizellomyces sp. 'palustris']|nr:hypothetical protein SpCBS45565_g00987 [Spizellomyces sp. 'palustris']